MSIAPSDAPPEKLEIDPRISQRRTAVIRDRGRRRLRLVVGVVAAVVVVVGVLGILHSSVFSARHVSVRGDRHTSLQSVLTVTGLDKHPPLIDVDLGASAREIERLPWVAHAVVSRRWPDSMSVTVTERTPVAVVARGAQVALIDGTGRVLAWDASAPGLPTLVAPGLPALPGTALPAGYQPGLTALRLLPDVLHGQVLQVDVTRSATVTLGLVGDVTVVLGPAKDLASKYEAAASVLAGAPAHGPEVIDVTVPTAPLVAVPAKKAPTAPAKVAATASKPPATPPATTPAAP